MRIVYIIDSLASKGGAERILSEKMSYMAERYGYDVSVVTCYQDPVRQANVYPLSDKVRQVNLNIPYYSQYRYGYPLRLWKKWQLYQQLKRQLAATVRSIDPDILVGLGYFQADVVTAIRCRAVKVVESHEARIFTMSDQGLQRSWLSRLYMRYYRSRYFRNVERQTDVVVTLTTGDAHEWRRVKRVEVIPNFTMMPSTSDLRPQTSDLIHHPSDKKRVMAVGRLEWQKGFDRLIDIWAMVAPRHPDWQLDIFGSGTMESSLQQLIAGHGLTHSAKIHPFTNHIQEEYLKSSLFVLPSRFEGFGLALLEAMQSGLSCVVFDCPYGPGDVVADGQSGFVVKDGDTSAFAARLEQLMSDDDLRQRFSERSVERAQDFAVDAVMMQCQKLIETLIA